MPQHVIRDIVARKGTAFQRLRFIISLEDQSVYISAEETPLGERYGEHIINV